MATIAVITLPLAGHMRPMLVACRALQKAGHRPVIAGPVDLIAKLPDGVETHIMGEGDLPSGALDTLCFSLSQMNSLRDFRTLFAAVARLSQFYVDHLPLAVEHIGADIILHDQLEPGAGIVARGLAQSDAIHHVSLACALPMNREPSIPPPLLGWRYRPGAFGTWLNAGYYRVVNAIMAQQGRVLKEAANRYGLSKSDHLEDWQQVWSVDDGLSRELDIVQGLACLDYPRKAPPLYLGPFRDDNNPYPGLEDIAPERDGRPLAFISLGTLMGGRIRPLTAMCRSAIRRGFQPVIVHGGRLEGGQEKLPTGTIIRDFLDQADILSEARAAIFHGGYNSTTDAVAAGVPLVLVPQAFEQGAIAARAERTGLGRAVSAFGPSLSQRIDLALGDIMRSPTFSSASRQARFEALAAPGVAGFVAAIDGLLGRGTVPTDRLDPSSILTPAPTSGVPVPEPAE